jgi:hypothetical protein
MIQFGIGAIYANPIGGNLATGSTPVQLGIIQDVSIDIDQKLVELRGQSKFPDDVAPSDMAIKGSAGFAKLDLSTFNNVFFADTITDGGINIANNEDHAIPATPFQVTTDNAADFETDLGVLYKATGLPLIRNEETLVDDESHPIPATPFQVVVTGAATFLRDRGVTDAGVPLTRVASSPATGEYSVDSLTGTYTFAAADTGDTVLISYSTAAAPATGHYTVNTTDGIYHFAAADTGLSVLISYEFADADGSTLKVVNHIQGYGPVFELLIVQNYQSDKVLKLHRVRISKMGSPMKRDGYLISPFDFQAYAALDGSVLDWFMVPPTV